MQKQLALRQHIETWNTHGPSFSLTLSSSSEWSPHLLQALNRTHDKFPPAPTNIRPLVANLIAPNRHPILAKAMTKQ
jgi:hypothetical protein